MTPTNAKRIFTLIALTAMLAMLGGVLYFPQNIQSFKVENDKTLTLVPPYLTRTSVFHKTEGQENFGQDITTKYADFIETDNPFYSVKQNLDSGNLNAEWAYGARRETRGGRKVNCAKLIRGDSGEIEKTKKMQEQNERSTSSDTIAVKNCTKYVRNKGYILSHLSKEELLLPIAYSIIMYKSADQFELLLRAIYRPQNYYCIHVDLKTSSEIYQSVSSIADCFPNVEMADRRIDVQWGKFSVVEADLLCMEQLLRHKQWKYFLNLTGQEFPLRTNFELVKILTIYNGSNDIRGRLKHYSYSRWRHAGKPPYGVHPIKGSVHITAGREFVEYVIYNRTARGVLDWVKEARVPDELFFNTMNFNPHLHVPGAYYKGLPDNKDFLTRFKLWPGSTTPCQGHRVRGICIFATGDLPTLARRPELFANKFHIDDNPYVLQCLDELIFNRTRQEYLENLKFNTTFYEQVNFLRGA